MADEDKIKRRSGGDDKKDAAGADQVKSTIAEEKEQGFRGTPVDKTPNHAYTVAGVTAGEETPETAQGQGD
jgi:hypothetical protein